MLVPGVTEVSHLDCCRRASCSSKQHLSPSEREREREREREWFIQEGNRAPVLKATHSRYRENPLARE